MDQLRGQELTFLIVSEIPHYKDRRLLARGVEVSDSSGWPCVEGVRSYVLGDMTILDGPFERARAHSSTRKCTCIRQSSGRAICWLEAQNRTG